MTIETLSTASTDDVEKHIEPTKSTPQKQQGRPARCWQWICIAITLRLFLGLLTFLVVIPVLFYLSPTLQRNMIFFNHPFPQVHHLEKNAFCCELRINSNDGIQLGAWYIPPKFVGCNQTKDPLSDLATAKRVIMYIHGATRSRGSPPSRLYAYHIFTHQLGAHVITFDYRHFGDSTPTPPSVEGVVNDTQAVYKTILSSGVDSKRILLWGHSLGSSITLYLLSRLNDSSEYPPAAVLEAPFTNIREEIPLFAKAAIYNWLPWFNALFVNPVVNNPETNFDSLAQLPKVRCPLLILHAEDDRTVPFTLGRKLYKVARQVQPDGIANQTQFHAFAAGRGYGHNNIGRAPNLPTVVRHFLSQIDANEP